MFLRYKRGVTCNGKGTSSEIGKKSYVREMRKWLSRFERPEEGRFLEMSIEQKMT